MSLSPKAKYVVPQETADVARAVFPQGNLCMTLADELDDYLSDEDFKALFPAKGQPGESPWRLALVTILQFVEGLTDRQAADAVRSRIDWKYLLCLELKDIGFHHSILSEFRTRLVVQQSEGFLFEQLLRLCQTRGLLKGKTRQRTDATHVLAAVRAVTRLECAGETLRAALNALAVVAPDWLQAHAQAEWVERYSDRVEDYHLPKSQTRRIEKAEQYGRDGLQVLDAVFELDSPSWLRHIPAVEVLRQVWIQQYYCCDGNIEWRSQNNAPPALVMRSSPYEPDAQYAKKKRLPGWVTKYI